MTQGLLRLMPALISTPVWYCLWLRRERKLTHWDQLKIVDLGSKSLLHLSKLSSNARRSNSHLVQSSPSTDDLAVQRFFRSFLFWKIISMSKWLRFPVFFWNYKYSREKKIWSNRFRFNSNHWCQKHAYTGRHGRLFPMHWWYTSTEVACRLGDIDIQVIFFPKIWNNCHIRNINCSFTHAFKLLFLQYASG